MNSYNYKVDRNSYISDNTVQYSTTRPNKSQTYTKNNNNIYINI